MSLRLAATDALVRELVERYLLQVGRGTRTDGPPWALVTTLGTDRDGQIRQWRVTVAPEPPA